MYGGSQYFYEEYYINNRQGNGNCGGQGSGGMGSGDLNSYVADIKEVDEFNILSYELSIPLHYF
ncbi:hypothetical protein ACJRPK_11375 [Aquimarina sp. 2-A2]|uniref:hypothetical protein n=1 Tax=Aquimarina sp. 2-A2 TaxID=3382644 RepID=UPI00387F1A20